VQNEYGEKGTPKTNKRKKKQKAGNTKPPFYSVNLFGGCN
jgi:hypothetical protein